MPALRAPVSEALRSKARLFDLRRILKCFPVEELVLSHSW